MLADVDDGKISPGTMQRFFTWQMKALIGKQQLLDVAYNTAGL